MKTLLIVLLAAGICHAQSYPTAKPRPKRSPSPSVYLPKGTVYTDKNGQDQLITGPGQTRNVTDAARDPSTGQRIYAPQRVTQKSRINAGAIGTGYPNPQRSINPSNSGSGYP